MIHKAKMVKVWMLAIIVFVGSTYPLNVEKENTENELTVKENFPLLRTQNER